ncbi:hypothetical protein TcasGA2_TC003585 [Tribolium castaneum]|uniref:Uncharacterized protein n=1 Tax=Tribolium castaneum TaxID=7070 RepID=D6WHW8_TRICA|nr:hypothetical protein TcasGA2_TC003585 [Tribolium castaneum]
MDRYFTALMERKIDTTGSKNIQTRRLKCERKLCDFAGRPRTIMPNSWPFNDRSPLYKCYGFASDHDFGNKSIVVIYKNYLIGGVIFFLWMSSGLAVSPQEPVGEDVEGYPLRRPAHRQDSHRKKRLNRLEKFGLRQERKQFASRKENFNGHRCSQELRCDRHQKRDSLQQDGAYIGLNARKYKIRTRTDTPLLCDFFTFFIKRFQLFINGLQDTGEDYRVKPPAPYLLDIYLFRNISIFHEIHFRTAFIAFFRVWHSAKPRRRPITLKRDGNVNERGDEEEIHVGEVVGKCNADGILHTTARSAEQKQPPAGTNVTFMRRNSTTRLLILALVVYAHLRIEISSNTCTAGLKYSSTTYHASFSQITVFYNPKNIISTHASDKFNAGQKTKIEIRQNITLMMHTRPLNV